jgi:hypothetical protein
VNHGLAYTTTIAASAASCEVALVGALGRSAIAVAVFFIVEPAYGQDTPPIGTSSAAPPKATSCSASYDCNIGFVCRDRTCVDGRGVACKANEDCAGGDACVLGICAVPAPKAVAAPPPPPPPIAKATSCKVDRDCPGEQICSASVCQDPGASCKIDRDCPGDQVCEAQHCSAAIPPCRTDRECPGDLICQAGACTTAGTCKTDRDCEGSLICDAGHCIAQIAPTAPADVTVTTSGDGPACKGLGKNECPEGMVCRYFKCQAPPPGSIEYAPFRIGAQSTIVFGRGQKLGNNSTAFAFGPDLTVSINKIFRFHFQLAGEYVSGFNGLYAAPLVLGFAIPIIASVVRFEIEIQVAVVQTEVLFGDGFNLGLGSGVRLNAVVGWGPLYLGIVPAGLELRYLAVHDDAAQPGIGLGQSLSFTLGYEN